LTADEVSEMEKTGKMPTDDNKENADKGTHRKLNGGTKRKHMDGAEPRAKKSRKSESPEEEEEDEDDGDDGEE